MRAAGLVSRHPEAWRGATEHPFLDSVRDGTLPAGAFEAWLGQDYLFVGDLLAFQSRLLARAPRPAQGVLAAGLVALEDELGWFEEMAKERGMTLGDARHPTTEAYRSLLDGLEEAPYPVAITALWALERAYLEAWRSAEPGHPDYATFVEHWTTPEFAGYVDGLEEAADAVLGADGSPERRVEEAFLEIASVERDFWEMALSHAAPRRAGGEG
ncbi:TenA family transcriptional regulator [Rubrobacter marinus]|uniref:Aminopyrimidine aminohydrolase n=1 Tax=Rubrobacter marinus TaxID=2653852 RepID=A0A6G8PTZ3_9ACTN|nr:TenA family transcriptional regulator [Rubrobacter marinus]QIN77552.1 TenA family transcriptional regulator [Rubrobacter marinus]